MSGLHSTMKKLDPFGHAVVEGIFGIEKAENSAKAAEAKAAADIAARDAADARAAKALEVRQVATRGQEFSRRAAAAGVTRSGNQQDWLDGSPTKPRRSRYASSVLLGG